LHVIDASGTRIDITMNETSERAAPFQLKGASFTMMVLKISDPEDAEFFPQLASKLKQAPSLFLNAPVVLDLAELAASGKEVDLAYLDRELRRHHLIPVGVQGGAGALEQAAVAAGLPVVNPVRGRADTGERVRVERAPSEPPKAPSQPPKAPSQPPATTPPPELAIEPPQWLEPPQIARNTIMVTEPIRSGRRVYAKGDLIVLAPVSQGAELLAEGHIHIYSSLRGRALAGASGDRSARIFCQSLEAELISIAGLYRVSEDIDPAVRKKSVQIFLEADRLRMDVMS
jgi:septum site-determining protein MinC